MNVDRSLEANTTLPTHAIDEHDNALVGLASRDLVEDWLQAVDPPVASPLYCLSIVCRTIWHNDFDSLLPLLDKDKMLFAKSYDDRMAAINEAAC
ncbi:MAG: hypothetical protein ABIP34_03430 [Rhodoferax sp.]|uniref:hypothetical protein n=1 Tax=Rhodoferax sp. TaxID=50421 RepID=UPI003262D488